MFGGVVATAVEPVEPPPADPGAGEAEAESEGDAEEKDGEVEAAPIPAPPKPPMLEGVKVLVRCRQLSMHYTLNSLHKTYLQTFWWCVDEMKH